ncbi:FMN-binding negative transcriptional regulator [Variovorax sp. YR216]|uniref:FMN-binding negative transcriptional regulator n=1 Tax=Variovorax sp. YR216 TaxID=1882828 RepID=UPI0008975F84|nr:FMN-binding negative transcriptional regulator [Variovorax sp. YR216]SEA49077.1 negative transcriptional regulator, PaiB family [Variovorax sp. YR216]
MYISKHHELPGTAAAHALIQAHPLGAWVVPGDDGLVANHVPFLLDPSRGRLGTLQGHVARANPVWRQLRASTPSLVMFQGQEAYITPRWYPGKRTHGKVVPTWNYAVAHARGVARAIDDEDWLRDLLARLTTASEASRPMPWAVADAPSEFIDKLVRAVVGIEIPIDGLVGKLKASQDEDLQDRWGTVEGLAAEGTDNARAMATLVRNAIDVQKGSQ